MKKYWWVFVLVIIALAALAFAFLYKKKPLQFDFSLGGDLASLLGLVMRVSERSNQKAGAYIDIPLKTIISNPNRAAALMQNIAGNLSFDGENIVQTKPGSAALQSVSVSGRGTAQVADTVQLMINAGTIKLIQQLIKGDKPVISYNFSAIVAGKPVNFKSTTPLKSN